jgi:SAM-dependent methyltransferase
MAHPEQRQWCMYVKEKFPERFSNANVLDFGSLDLNGSNRYLFENCRYTGIDIGIGTNVDVVSKAHEYVNNTGIVDIIITTEMAEHDQYIDKSLKNMTNILKSDGLFILTCATYGRQEHGTVRSNRGDSPFTTLHDDWKDYYRNLGEAEIRSFINVDEIFKEYQFDTFACDLRFYGIKR